MDTNFEQKVRERAYEIWMSAGMEDGMAHDHWVAAEQAVKSEGTKKTTAKKAKVATAGAAKKPAAKPVGKAVTAKGAAKAATKAVVAKAAKAKPASELRH